MEGDHQDYQWSSKFISLSNGSYCPKGVELENEKYLGIMLEYFEYFPQIGEGWRLKVFHISNT